MSPEAPDPGPQIGSLNENPLHAALKEWYRKPGDAVEVAIDGFVIDIVRGEQLIEIQTQGFSSLKRKLRRLTEQHPVRLVYPIALDKWIVKIDSDRCTPLSRRKSPKHGIVEDLFAELVSFPGLIGSPNFVLEVLLTHEEELRRREPGRAWRRQGWVIHERRLLDVVDRKEFRTTKELAALLPASLPEPFTTADLATSLGRPRRLGQQMAYCLRKAGALLPVGHSARSVLYRRIQPPLAGESVE
jgi:hypothetical protein